MNCGENLKMIQKARVEAYRIDKYIGKKPWRRLRGR
jgi:hypothetical protein